MQLLGLALAVVVGLSLGLLGGGGSILTVPIFVYVLGFAAKPAIAMSLPVVGATSSRRRDPPLAAGNVQPPSRAGLRRRRDGRGVRRCAARDVRQRPVQLTLLAIAMLAAAVSMFRSGRAPTAEHSTTPPASTAAMLGVLASASGLLTGLVGIGGGFLVVPALVLLAGCADEAGDRHVARRDRDERACRLPSATSARSTCRGRSSVSSPHSRSPAFWSGRISCGSCHRPRSNRRSPGFLVMLRHVDPHSQVPHSRERRDGAREMRIMLLKRFYDEKLAQASYLVGCAATGEALVVDRQSRRRCSTSARRRPRDCASRT